jgi:hypothetical protein
VLHRILAGVGCGGCFFYLNGKGKGVPLHAMQAHGGRGGIAPAHT